MLGGSQVFFSLFVLLFIRTSMCVALFRHCSENGMPDGSDSDGEVDLLSIERGAGTVDRLFLVQYALEDFGEP